MSNRWRRKLRFQIRTLLLAMTVLAVVCVLFSRRIARSQSERVAAARIKARGGNVIYGHRESLPRLVSGRLLSELLYEDFSRVTSVNLRRTHVSDDDLMGLAVFTRMDDLDLSGTNVTDPKLRHLRRLSTLRSVNLCQTSVSPLAVQQFKSSSPKIVLH